MHALQRRWSELFSRGVQKNLLVLWYSCRLTHRFISTQGCYWAVALRTSTKRLDKSWLYIVFPRRSQMKCTASLSASVHRHGVVLKHWPCSGPFWICYGSRFPWTVTTLNRPLLMVSYTVCSLIIMQDAAPALRLALKQYKITKYYLIRNHTVHAFKSVYSITVVRKGKGIIAYLS